MEPFLDANRAHLQRLGTSTRVETRGGIRLLLTPGSRIGAVPLLSPATRRVAAGFLVAPRFRWSALGAVLGETGFATDPVLGGTPLVPGSAREVPVWLLAAPVIRRLESLLRHRRRGFPVCEQERSSPRGQVQWSRWATRHVPSGAWNRLPCRYSEPDDDPGLMAAVRWTVAHLDAELAPFHEAPAARLLRSRLSDLRLQVGDGETRRPMPGRESLSSGWVAEATQAMGWVAEQRGLGGDRVLDGMSWDLAIDAVWEAWVAAFLRDLAPRCGLTALAQGETARRLNWATTLRSMTMLVPDAGLRGSDRLVWVDAKYKAHLQLLARQGWSALDESTRDAHRADLHQALTYASLQPIDRVDSLLVYPELAPGQRGRHAIASLATGRRRVRLLLLGLPFGFQSPGHRQQTLADWRELLAA